MTLMIDRPECAHGIAGGTPQTCALCRRGITEGQGALPLLPPGVRPMPRNFRDLVDDARAGRVTVDTSGPVADRPSPHDEPMDFEPALNEPEDARTRQLPRGDRE